MAKSIAIDLQKRCWAEIDLSALERNLKLIRSALPAHIQYVAVVKADAYGHGMAQTVTRLMHCGADLFAVANVLEGAAIREIGSGWPILVLSSILPEEDKHITEYNLIPTLSTAEEAERFSILGKQVKRRISVHLKIDTGLGRLGVWHERALELYELIQEKQDLRLEGIYTHFSSADSDPEFTNEQRKLFLQTLDRLPGLDTKSLLIHADNSAGLESFKHGQPFNAVRVGLLQFGVLPYPDSLLSRVKVAPVFSFHSRIGLVKDLPAGTGISYGRSHVLKRDSRIAVITAGYGDGVPTTMSNKGSVLIHGHRCPILGRVTMDQTVVDITGLENTQSGDSVTFIGKQGNESIDVTTFSNWASSIPWETFCSITKRVPRIYHIDSAI
jgi:alanine racemase